MAPKPPDLGVDPGTLSRVGVLRDSARPAGESEGVAAVKPQPILSVAADRQEDRDRRHRLDKTAHRQPFLFCCRSAASFTPSRVTRKVLLEQV